MYRVHKKKPGVSQDRSRTSDLASPRYENDERFKMCNRLTRLTWDPPSGESKVIDASAEAPGVHPGPSYRPLVILNDHEASVQNLFGSIIIAQAAAAELLSFDRPTFQQSARKFPLCYRTASHARCEAKKKRAGPFDPRESLEKGAKSAVKGAIPGPLSLELHDRIEQFVGRGDGLGVALKSPLNRDHVDELFSHVHI